MFYVYPAQRFGSFRLKNSDRAVLTLLFKTNLFKDLSHMFHSKNKIETLIFLGRSVYQERKYHILTLNNFVTHTHNTKTVPYFM